MTRDKMATPETLGPSGTDAGDTAGADDAIEWGSTHAARSAPTRISSRLAISAPAALGVLLLAGAVTFGHSTGFFARMPDLNAGAGFIELDDEKPTAATPKPNRYADAVAAADKTPKPTPLAAADKTPRPTAIQKPKPTAAPKPSEEAVAQVDPATQPAAQPAPTVKPAPPAPTPKPQPAPPAPQPPVTATLSLGVLPSDRIDKVQLGWTAYSGEGFMYYKVVRSRDGHVTWPASGDDEVIGAIGNPAETGMRDRPECGTTFFYAVFAVRKADGAYQVLAPSNVVSAATTCQAPPPPPPATQAIGLQASFADGKVNLSWGACDVAGFNAWKIVRSQTNPDPRYPDNGGAELIAAIGDPHQLWFSDGAVASGQTWYYRVLARADQGGGNFIACESAVAAVTIP